jgi:hypothetical protein
VTRARVRRDPLLPEDGDYPTDGFDLTDMSNPYVRAIVEDVTVDANDAHHSKATGRFVTKRLDYSHLVVHPDVPGVDRPFTWAEYEALSKGPDADAPHVTVYDVPPHPDVEPVVRRPLEYDDSPGVGIDMVSVCCPDCVYGPAEKIEPRKTVGGREASGRKKCVYVRKSDRTPCTETTSYTDSAGRPACHYHGGKPF